MRAAALETREGGVKTAEGHQEDVYSAEKDMRWKTAAGETGQAECRRFEVGREGEKVGGLPRHQPAPGGRTAGC